MPNNILLFQEISVNYCGSVFVVFIPKLSFAKQGAVTNDSLPCFHVHMRQARIVGEARDVPVKTIKAWMERLPEIILGYAADDIWNMGESGLFLKALPYSGLAAKRKKAKGGKRSKERLTVAFFMSSSGGKVC